MKLAKFI